MSDEEAAFTVIGAIALQGIRLANPTLGETVVVTGLGLIGLVTIQLLKANGCRALGIDLDQTKLALARQMGAETVDLSQGGDAVAAGMAFSRGRGVDAVLITAATRSNEPIRQAAQMSRKRGRIVLVGVVGLDLSRADFYEKELSFQVSCSYGPGRYDPDYEEGGNDYPVGFVRWTEQRNFEAVLDMMADGRMDLSPLVTHRYPLDDVERAYELVSGGEHCLGIVLEYPNEQEQPDLVLRRRTVELTPVRNRAATADSPVFGFIGAGNYATQVLIPAFKLTGAELHSVASSTGISGAHAGRKFGFRETTTDPAALISNSSMNAVVVTTRHDSHARYTCDALRAGKHVFVEKPLALTRDQLTEIEAVYSELDRTSESGSGPTLMVGFNRRFAPQVRKIKSLLESVCEPASFVMTVNAGDIPPSHWTQDPEAGGGRIIGEACHFIDLLRYLAGAPASTVQATMLGDSPGLAVRDDKVSFTIGFDNGSFGTVHYLANGHKAFPKERLEVFCQGGILQLDNFRRLKGYGWPGFGKMNLARQDKGQRACAAAFVEALRDGRPSPIPFEELAEVTRLSFDIVESLRS